MPQVHASQQSRPAAAGPNMTRSTSYVLVSSSLPDPPSEPDYVSPVPRSRPRFYFWLPILAALDAISTLVLALAILHQHERSSAPGPEQGEDGHGPSLPSDGQPFWDRDRMMLSIVGVAMLRASTFAIVGFSKRIRELGITIAAVSILSALYSVSVANLLFQARAKPIPSPTPDVPRSGFNANLTWSEDDPDGTMALSAPQPSKVLEPVVSILLSATTFRLTPSMSVLVGSQLAFTAAEWMAYIAIVGVKVPPGGNPVKANRWARSLANDPRYVDGVEAASLYATDSDRDEASNDGEDERDHVEADDDGNDEDRHTHHSRSLSAEARGAATHASMQFGGGSRPSSSLLASNEASELVTDETTLLPATEGQATLQSPRRNYGSTGQRLTPQRRANSSEDRGNRGSVRSNKAPGLKGSLRSLTFPSSSGSPRTAELGLVGLRGRDLEGNTESDDEEDDDDDQDPDDIIDISSDRRLSRHASRRRLALAAHPERRISGGALSSLGIGLGGSGSIAGSKPLGISLGGGSGLFGRQRADGSSSSDSPGGNPRSWTATGSRLAEGKLPRSVSTSASQGGLYTLGAGSSADPAAAAASPTPKPRKMPGWLSRSKSDKPAGGGRRGAARP